MRSLPAFQLFALLLAGVLFGCGQSPAPDDEVRQPAPPVVRVVPVGEVLSGADIPTLDPATMTRAEVERVLGNGPTCEMRYVSTGKPILAVTPAGAPRPAGVVKLNGGLIVLQRAATSTGSGYVAGPMSLMFRQLDSREMGAADRGPVEAELVLRIGQDLEVGYKGYFACAG